MHTQIARLVLAATLVLGGLLIFEAQAEATTCTTSFNASSTSSASNSNTDLINVSLNAGTAYTFTTCSSASGDTYLRLKNGSSQVAYNDDACTGYKSTINYTPSSSGTYTIWAGCYSSGTCSGSVEITPDPCAQGGGGNTMGALGDSISTGMDADDDCDTLVSCAGKLGEDRGYSFATGADLSVSLRNKLGYTQTNEQQKNGATWMSSAKNQAVALVNAGGADHVSIELGGNDVCQKRDNSTLPSKAQIRTQVKATLQELVDGLAPGSTVVLAETPDVVNLYHTMKGASNFAFKTCQDMWNLDTSRIEVNTCDWGFFDFLCDIADFIVEVTADFVDFLDNENEGVFGIKFPCGTVLNSGNASPGNVSQASRLGPAEALNKDINDVLAEELPNYNGTNGVTIKLANNIDEYQFTQPEVSQLDCFHPSRLGQYNLAVKVYDGAGLGTPNALATDTTDPIIYTATSDEYWVNSTYDGVYNDTIRFLFDSDEIASIEIYTYVCPNWYSNAQPSGNSPNSAWQYWGTTNELPSDHRFDVTGLSYNNWTSVWVRPTDRSGNAGGWYYTDCM